MAKDKDTIYIDIDDEITGIIDKVRGSDGKVVALVLPKRAAVFQSIVNKKHLVLITSEAGLLPLAGAAGVHVAKTLTSKPEIPGAPELMDDIEEEVPEDPADGVPLNPDKTLQEHAEAGAAAGISPPPSGDDVETVVLDDDDVPPEADAAAPAAKTFEPPKGTNKKLKIPDFDRFRLLLVGGGLLLILLIFGFIFANTVLPKATINIKTDATAVDTNLTLNLSTAAKELDASNNTLPAKLASISKTYTASVPTTGQKNNGTRATGTVKMSAQYCHTLPPIGGPADVPTGTGVSHDSLTYITQNNTSFSSNGSYNSSTQCTTFDSISSTNITAQTGGANYNTGSGNFTVAGRSEVSGTGSASGGTDNIQQVVNQNDINSAKNKITVSDSDLKKALESSLGKDNYYAIAATYSAGTPNVTTSNNVGEAANNLTVTEAVTYTMFGVHKADLQTLIKNAIKDQIDTSKQAILDDGLNKASFNVDNQTADKAQLTMSATAAVGPDLDIASIKSEAAGQKPGAVKDKLSANPDVTNVDIKLSPFWVGSVPKKTSKITVNIAKPTTRAGSSNGSNP
jgi:hypothetical protein